MGYFVIFLAGVLVIGLLALLRTRGAGGIPNPMAGWNMPAITALTRGQLTLAIVPLIILSVIFIVIPDLFPGFTDRYNGPVWMLLFLLGIMALAAVIPYNFIRIMVYAVVALPFLLSVVPSIWDALPSWSSSPSTHVRTAATRRTVPATPHCLGNAKTVTVGSDWVEINPGFHCKIVFNTIAGVSLLGEPGKYVEDAPGLDLGNVMKDKGVKVVYAKAKTARARVEYMLCPHDRGCS